MPRNWWSIVLAGGSGERLREWVRQRYGAFRPKQYCVLVGSRSLFQHTLDRADLITVPDHKVIVIAEDHREEATAQWRGRGGHLVGQPENRGTAAGIFLALSYVAAHEPDAIVVVYPSDHFIIPEAPFVSTVRQALEAAEFLRGRVILLGVAPDSADRSSDPSDQSASDFGWITAGDVLETPAAVPVRAVTRFIEKPAAADAAALRREHGLWNTFVFAARAKTLWDLGRRYVPTVIEALAPLRAVIGTDQEQAALDDAYRAMPCFSFSREVLEAAADRAAVIQLVGAHWSDWGRPERIADSLALADLRLT